MNKNWIILGSILGGIVFFNVEAIRTGAVVDTLTLHNQSDKTVYMNMYDVPMSMKSNQNAMVTRFVHGKKLLQTLATRSRSIMTVPQFAISTQASQRYLVFVTNQKLLKDILDVAALEAQHVLVKYKYRGIDTLYISNDPITGFIKVSRYANQ